MAGYFGHVGGHVPPYTVSNHGLNHPAPNIDFFNPMAPPSCGKCSRIVKNLPYHSL